MNEMSQRFNYHPPRNPEDVAAHDAVRTRLQQAAEYFKEALPEGREKALVLTKLEEAMFWANAALARERAREEAG